MPDSVSTVNAASGTDVTSLLGAMPARKVTSNAFDKDMFLKLLVAQLKNQNPLQPTDPSEFMNQAATLAMVEQMNAVSSSTNEAAAWQRGLAAAALTGKTITGIDASGASVTGAVDKVTITSGKAVLSVGSSTVDFASVTSVSK